MILELPIRWTETDREASKEEELIRGDKAEEKVKYTYGKLLIKAEDIGPYYDLDPHNTMINDKLGKVYCVTIPVDQFKKIMTEITGNAIMALQVREEIPSKPKRPPQPPSRPKNDDDNILL